MKRDDLYGIALLLFAVGCVAFGLYLTSLPQPNGLRSLTYDRRGDLVGLLVQGLALIFLVIGLLAAGLGITNMLSHLHDR